MLEGAILVTSPQLVPDHAHYTIVIFDPAGTKNYIVEDIDVFRKIISQLYVEKPDRFDVAAFHVNKVASIFLTSNHSWVFGPPKAAGLLNKVCARCGLKFEHVPYGDRIRTKWVLPDGETITNFGKVPVACKGASCGFH